MLSPGTYIDSHWGHYQTPRTIELALELGYVDSEWSEEDIRELITAYTEGEESVSLPNAIIQEQDYLDYLTELYYDAESYINDNHVPEGYWFGYHSDIGDVGVWECDDN